MSPAARSIHVFGLYLLGVGFVVLAVPNLLFDVLGVPATDEPWIRILGLVVGVVGFLYFVAARNNLVPLFRATVAGRIVVGIGLILIVGVWGYWSAVAFGVVDLVGATWTALALRRDSLGPTAPQRVETGSKP